MASLVIKMADLTGAAIGSGQPATAEVLVGYTWDVSLADGTILSSAPVRKTLGSGGTVSFNVTPSDDPTVHPDWQGFGVHVEWRITYRGNRGRQEQVHGSRTVQVLASHGATVQFGTLEPAEPIPPRWTSAEDMADELDAAVAAAQSSQAAAQQSAADAQTALQAQFMTQDEGVAALIGTAAGPETQEALARSTALLPGRAVSGAIESTGTVVAAVTVIDGVVYGSSNNTNIYASTDDGASWTVAGAISGGSLQMIAKAPDGEMVAWTASQCFKSSGWAGGTPTWSLKITTNGAATFNRFTISAPDWDGLGAAKMICSQYGPGEGQSWIDSRYAHISTDGGDTWTLAYDSDLLTGNAPGDSHVHGSCYDPISDTFFVSEGHGSGYGVYASTDDGVTWTRMPGMTPPVQPSYTDLVATDDGLVGASDSVDAGVFGIVRDGPVSQWKAIRTWRWNAGGDTGVNGHGQANFRDPTTGVVYIAYRASTPNARAIIAAATPITAREVYTWTGGYTAGDQFQSVAVSGGYLLSGGTFAGTRVSLRARLSPLGAVTVEDAGNITSGYARSNASVAVGPRSSTGDVAQSVALGVAASSGGAGQVIIGAGAASTNGSRSVLIGRSASGSAADQVAVGGNTNPGSYGFVTLIGSASTATGAQAVAAGRNATATTDAVAVGGGASATVNGGVAIGRNATAGHDGSVAFGKDSATTSANQVQVGARHIELAISNMAATPTAGKGRIGFEDNGAGKAQLIVRWANGSKTILATEP